MQNLERANYAEKFHAKEKYIRKSLSRDKKPSCFCRMNFPSEKLLSEFNYN